MKEEFIWED